MTNRNTNSHVNNDLIKDVNISINKDINRSINTLTVAKGLSAYFLFSKKTVIGYGQRIKYDLHHDIQVYQP